jgi:tRNA(Ile)-lysidine synthase
MDLVRKTKETILREGLIDEGDRVLVGCSGGLDSVALLFVLREISHDLPFELGIAHVNHSLRGEESDRDEDFVKGLADRFSILCYSCKANVKDEARESGKSLQHAGRDIRYRFFNEIANQLDFNKIAIAHNLDDQVETFLLRVVKGTGIRGLSSIQIRRGRIIRPFLPIYRSEIETYVKTRAISFVEDSSNAKSVYERNFVRREILPVMEKLNPAAKDKIYALLHDLTLINTIFDRKAVEFLSGARNEEGSDIVIDVHSLKMLDEEVRRRVIANLLRERDPNFLPLREHFKLIEKILDGRRPNLSITFPRGNLVQRRYANLVFTKKSPAQKVEEVFAIHPGTNRVEPLDVVLHVAEIEEQSDDIQITTDIAYFDGEKLGNLSVRTFIPGDRFVPLGMGNAMKLKDFFIGRKIPKDQRQRIPLLLSDQDIIWVVGYRIDERYKISKETKRVLRVTVTGDQPENL